MLTGALRVAPADRAETIMIAIPDGVEACARADFETPKRQASLLGDLKKTSDQHARSTDLVRLWGRRQEKREWRFDARGRPRERRAAIARLTPRSGDSWRPRAGASSVKASPCSAPAILSAKASATGSPGHARANSAVAPAAAMSSRRIVSSPAVNGEASFSHHPICLSNASRTFCRSWSRSEELIGGSTSG